MGAVAAWLRKGELEATAIHCEPYNKNGFKDTLAQLRSLTNEADPGTFRPRLLELCAQHGVAVVFVPAPCPRSRRSMTWPSVRSTPPFAPQTGAPLFPRVASTVSRLQRCTTDRAGWPNG